MTAETDARRRCTLVAIEAAELPDVLSLRDSKLHHRGEFITRRLCCHIQLDELDPGACGLPPWSLLFPLLFPFAHAHRCSLLQPRAAAFSLRRAWDSGVRLELSPTYQMQGQ